MIDSKIVEVYIQSLLSEDRGGKYVMSHSGNSQLVDPPRELFISRYQRDSLLNVCESSEIGFRLSQTDSFFALQKSLIDCMG